VPAPYSALFEAKSNTAERIFLAEPPTRDLHDGGWRRNVSRKLAAQSALDAGLLFSIGGGSFFGRHGCFSLELLFPESSQRSEHLFDGRSLIQRNPLCFLAAEAVSTPI
jgi:hypothetical protein